MTEEQANNITVQIYGSEYSIKGDSDVEYMQEIATYIDRKMKDIQQNTSTKPALKVAILAALNIVDELFRERELNAKAMTELEQKISKLTELVMTFEDQQ
ncbi:MAG: cell division protein ZapA [Calditrichaeota bacterium]|nr:MAG: cell division protein ZapA [Calditrichota bacterium]